MRPRRVLQILIGLAPAVALAAPDDLEISLRAVLVNTREAQAQLDRIYAPSTTHGTGCESAGCLYFWGVRPGPWSSGGPPLRFSREVFHEKDSLCAAFGSGCLLVNYTEDPAKILVDPTFRSSSTDGSAMLRTREISFTGIARANDSRSNRTDPLLNHFDELMKEEEPAYRSWLERLQRPDVTLEVARDFIRFVVEHPRVANLLPQDFAQGSQADAKRGSPSARTLLLERAIVTLALLTLEALVKVADSQSPTYPYLADGLVPAGSLLDLDRAYEELKKIGRWPRIQHLSRGEREKLDPVFIETDGEGHYQALGVYLPDSNTVRLDLTEPFFDTVYTLYHELWHTAVFHSPRTESVAAQIRALLRESPSPAADTLIRATLLRFFAEHELLAIDQSARLFRATGHLVKQWGETPTAAAGWHNSYFGDEEETNLFIPRALRARVKQDLAPNPIALMFIVPAMIELPVKRALAQRRAEALARALETKKASTLVFSRFLESRTVEHLDHYRKRYLTDIEAIDIPTLREEQSFKTSPAILPKTVDLTCSEVARLADILGKQGDYGLPFPFTVQGGWESCQSSNPRFLELRSHFKPRCSLPHLRPLEARAAARKEGPR